MKEYSLLLEESDLGTKKNMCLKAYNFAEAANQAYLARLSLGSQWRIKSLVLNQTPNDESKTGN